MDNFLKYTLKKQLIETRSYKSKNYDLSMDYNYSKYLVVFRLNGAILGIINSPNFEGMIYDIYDKKINDVPCKYINGKIKKQSFRYLVCNNNM
ncbi:MAG: hypothetical protein LBF23_02330 [Endomicrobium sp.]|jgi:hypothetical protein|nr:hypothetical protein [Endomicrobium sp.]